jgi:hypothetical protein
VRVLSSVKYACLPRSAAQEGISVSGTEGVLSLALDRVALHLGDIVNPRALNIILLILYVLGTGNLARADGQTEALARIALSSTALSPRGIREASAPALVGRAEAAARAPSMENESRVTAEVLHVESVHSSQLNIAPPQFFTRVRLRLLTVGDTSGTPSFLTGRDGTVLDAYTREQVTADLLEKKIECKIRYRGDERGGMYWLYEIRALSGSS